MLAFPERYRQMVNDSQPFALPAAEFNPSLTMRAERSTRKSATRAPGKTVLIRFENVGLRYGMGPEVLRDISFHIPAKSFQFLSGPSGAGHENQNLYHRAVPAAPW